MELILIIIVVFMARGLVKALLGALNTSAPLVVSNTMRGLENLSNAAPSLGALGGMQGVALANEDVENLKAQVGCADDNIVTMLQLQEWMRGKAMF